MGLLHGLLILFGIGCMFSIGWYFSKKNEGLAKGIACLWVVLFLGATHQYEFNAMNVFGYWLCLFIAIAFVESYTKQSQKKK